MLGRLADALTHVFFLLAIGFLILLAGMLMSVAGVFPATYVQDAYRAGTALYEKMNLQHNRYATDLWREARTGQRGVTQHDPGQVQPGLTLYTSGDGPVATLIDPNGEIVHQWQRPYSDVWDDTAPVRDPVPDDQVYFRRSHVYPNGDLLTLYEGVGDTPFGYGMVRLDRESSVVWKNLDHFHHDFDIGPDGRIYGLTHGYRFDHPEHTDHFSPPFLDDHLAIVSPEGRTLKKISLVDAINRSQPHRQLLWRIPFYSMEDPLHANAVDVLDEARAASLAQRIPQAAAGQILISMRELDGGSIVLLDPESETIVWATRGPWIAQHDPDILPNGHLLVFDNLGHYGAGGKSRIIEVDPATGGIVRQVHIGTEARPFESRIRGTQQRLANGNTLITESDGGRLVEVNPAGDIVWEFINPVRGGEEARLIPVVSAALRIDPTVLTADFSQSLSGRMTAQASGVP